MDHDYREYEQEQEQRYGTDALYTFFMCMAVVLAIVRLFVGGVAGIVLLVLIALTVGVAVWRLLSRNSAARRHENRVFLRLLRRIWGWLRLCYIRLADRSHSYSVCPCCRAVLRSRGIGGEVELHCPRCGEKFLTYIKPRNS